MTNEVKVKAKTISFEPSPMEIWEVDDCEIRFVPDDKRNKHHKRYVLVLMNKELCSNNNPVYNIVPMSTKGEPDILRFPLNSNCFSYIADDGLNKSTSLLVLNHYQPINSRFLKKKAGVLNEDIYWAATNQIKEALLGLIDDNDNLDDEYLDRL